MLGVEQPVFYRGEIAGTVRKYSDVLLIFLLKVTRPNIYRENRHVTADVNVTTISSHPNCDGTVQSWVCLSPAMSRVQINSCQCRYQSPVVGIGIVGVVCRPMSIRAQCRHHLP